MSNVDIHRVAVRSLTVNPFFPIRTFSARAWNNSGIGEALTGAPIHRRKKDIETARHEGERCRKHREPVYDPKEPRRPDAPARGKAPAWHFYSGKDRYDEGPLCRFVGLDAMTCVFFGRRGHTLGRSGLQDLVQVHRQDRQAHHYARIAGAHLRRCQEAQDRRGSCNRDGSTDLDCSPTRKRAGEQLLGSSLQIDSSKQSTAYLQHSSG